MSEQNPSPEEEDSEEEYEAVIDPPTKETPFFSGEQVEYLLRTLAFPQNVAEPHVVRTEMPPEPRTRGGYASKLGWMHLASPELALHLVLGVGLMVLGIIYFLSPLQGDGVVMAQPFLLIGLGLVFLVRTVVKWQRSYLRTTSKHIVYGIKAFWPLLILAIEQKGKIQEIDASVYRKNFLEEVFKMNSGTLTVDTAAQGDEGLHQIKGVKDISLLRADIE